MKKNKLLLACLLVAVTLLSLTLAGCGTTQEAPPSPKPSSNSSSELLAPDNPQENASVTVYVFTPVDWSDVYVWAWKDGGQDAFPAWPGIQATHNPQAECVSASVPAWIDRLVISTQGGSVQTADLTVEAGKDVWLAVTEEEVYIYYENPLAGREETQSDDPLYRAAQQGDYETWKSLLPSIEDRSVLNNWIYDNFNYDYALECFRAGDYETCTEFLGYCTYEDYQLYGQVIELLLRGEREAALDTINSIGFTIWDIDLDMSWAEIVCKVTGLADTASDLDLLLMDKYVSLRLRSYERSFTEDTLVFGESNYQSYQYVGEIQDTDSYLPVANLNTLKSQCGREAAGKILVLRSQAAYPQGNTYYAIDLPTMDYLSADLYPASLSEVEYILIANYGYNVEGYYEQSFTNNGDVVDQSQFAFLRMKGQVQLLNVKSGQTVQTCPWVYGPGEVDLYFGDEGYECSGMPETGPDIYHCVQKVRELNASQN